MLGHRQHRRDFVMLVDEIDVHRVLAEIDHAGLQRGVDAAERHVHGLRAIGREHRVLGRGRLHANLQALDILDLADFLLAVHVAEALGAEADHMNALGGLVDHVADRFEHLLVAERLDVVIFRSEQEVQRHHAGLRRDRRRCSPMRRSRNQDRRISRAAGAAAPARAARRDTGRPASSPCSTP